MATTTTNCSEQTKSANFALRRTQSVNKAEQVSHAEKLERKRQPDKPVHQPRDSLLSSSSGYNNYRGFLNLCIILLVLSNGRVALENVIKYGILINPRQWISMLIHEPFHWPSIILMLFSNVFILIAFKLEKLLSTAKVNTVLMRRLQIANLVTVIIFPTIIVWFGNLHPFGASLALMVYSIVFLKLISYIMVNEWCRDARSHVKVHRRQSHSFSCTKEELNLQEEITVATYPNNLTIPDLYYFMFVPTLCYELNFPRSTRIRKSFLLKRIIEMLFLSQLMIALIQQWMVPIILNSTSPFQEMDYTRMLERLLKLAVPNILIWLIFFYWIFHSSMNFMGEILQFADREFYRDWWNSETIQHFWQNWNIPVHRWCVRHLYLPLLKKGYKRSSAALIVFLVSAFFHEYLVSIPLKMFRVWAFMGMLAQIPLALIVSLLHEKYANMAVWLSLIIGQPLAMLMYYHDYYLLHYDTNGTVQ